MKFYEIQLLPHGAGTGSLVVYDSSDPVKIEEALSRGVSLTTAQPGGGKYLLLEKTDREYALTVTTRPPRGPGSKSTHETLKGALNEVAEIENAAEELERGEYG